MLDVTRAGPTSPVSYAVGLATVPTTTLPVARTVAGPAAYVVSGPDRGLGAERAARVPLRGE